MSLPPAIIFDWDNTLIDTFPLLKEATNLVRAHFKLPAYDDAQARQNIRLTAKESYPQIYGERWQEAHALFYEHIRAKHLERIDVIDGATALLNWIKDQKIPMGLLSNKHGAYLRKEVTHLGWGPYFQIVLGPDDVGDIGKPQPDGLHAALNALAIPPTIHADCWYVGDTENDLRTAHAAGVIPVFIENQAMSLPEAIAREKPRFSFKNCAECLDYLKSVR